MRLPDLDVRIVGAPMAGGPSTPELVAAVSDAGGLGTVAGGYLSTERLGSDLARVAELTRRPFAVNLFAPITAQAATARSETATPETEQAVAAYVERLRPFARDLGVEPGEPRFDDDAFGAKLDVVLDARPALVTFTFGTATARAVDRLHEAGIPVAVTITDPRQLAVAVAVGADALVLQGWEAGGHRGGLVEDDRASGGEELALIDLLARVRATTDLPLLAAGGLADGDSIAAVLRAGAWAAVVGTALLRTPEAGTSAPHRAALAERRPTVVSRAFTGRSARGLDNAFTRANGEHAPRAYPQVHHVTAPLRAESRRRGDAENINLWAGTAADRAEDRPAGELVREWHAQVVRAG